MPRVIPRRARLLALAACALTLAQAAVPGNVPWKVHQTSRAAFPERMMRSGVTRGEARVRLSVSEEGKLLDALVVACTERDFGDEALRAARTWRFDPERVNGASVGVVADILFTFVVNGTVAIDQRAPSGLDDDGRDEAKGYRAAGMKSLDRIPEPTHVVSPSFPPEWRARGLTGTAIVEFYIDETGAVRIPLVVTATHPELDASAVTAVGQWKFQSPTRRGQPVLARAEQVFRFE